MPVTTLQFKAPAIDIGKPAGLEKPLRIVASGSGKTLQAVVHSCSGSGKTFQVRFDSQAVTARKLRHYMTARVRNEASIKAFVFKHRQSMRNLPVFWCACQNQPIPPRSVVKLVSADDGHSLWESQRGTIFRVGYYNKNDGLNTIWLVDHHGNYCQTTDLASLKKHFKIIRLASETDLFGKNRAPLRPLAAAMQPA